MKNKKSKTEKTGNISRRGFLKGAGIAAAGTVIVGSGILISKPHSHEKDEKFVPGTISINMKVNGKIREMNIEPRTTLADALRSELHLTGTKVGCNRGACSACTVWIDGIPTLSCMTLAVEVGDREVTTIEGLAKDDRLHPVQEAFIEHDATQCGFCTPGMIMTAAHLLARNPSPTEDDVKKATSGNFCRCGTHPKVFAATLDAAHKA
ncbi:MAG: (2Fe-2S)-binding protein [Chlorobi bacterium]|nr:(2Fe-2S)-binding protein [Chlorobiota bacterium]